MDNIQRLIDETEADIAAGVYNIPPRVPDMSVVEMYAYARNLTTTIIIGTNQRLRDHVYSYGDPYKGDRCECSSCKWES